MLVPAVNNTELTGEITGKIEANPNPLFFGQRCVISWETNDPTGAEICVSTGMDDEKLVAQGGSSGHVEIPWIKDSKAYEFRLYVGSNPGVAIDSVRVRRDIESAPAALREIADEVKRGNIEMSELSQFIASVMPRCLQSAEYRELFLNWERHGFHVTPVHFYEPIPDTQSLPETLWSKPSELVGIEMNDQCSSICCETTFQNSVTNTERFQRSPSWTADGHFVASDRAGRLLYGPSLSATVDHRGGQRFFFSAVGPSRCEKQELPLYLHRTVSARGSSQE